MLDGDGLFTALHGGADRNSRPMLAWGRPLAMARMLA